MQLKKRLSHLSLQQQFSAVVFFLFLIFTLLLTLFLSWQERNRVVHSKIEQGKIISSIFASHSVLPLLYDSPDSIEAEIGTLMSFPDLVHISILNSEGQTLYDRGESHFHERKKVSNSPFSGQLVKEDEKYWHFSADVYTHKLDKEPSPFILDQPSPEFIGHISISITKATLQKFIRGLFIKNGLIALAFSIFIWLVLSWFSRLITKPLKQLTYIMEEKELRTNEENKGSKEMVAISTAYNQLVNELKKRQTRLDEKNQQLSREMDERMLAEQESRRLQQQLQQAQKMEAIGQLTGGIAHDFNNILASIIGYSTLAEDRFGNTDEKLFQYLQEISRSGRRARDLVAQMLTFSRGSHAKQSDQNTKILVEETVKMMKPTLPSTIKIITEYGKDLNRVQADHIQLTQAIMNLCINARDAMGGKGKIVISVNEHLIENKVCNSCHLAINGYYQELSIRDTGNGIPPDVLIRIFEPFFSTKDIGKGSGMGLSVVKNIVHELGGHILVDSRIHHGTNFRLLFPIKAPSKISKEDLQYKIAIIDRDASISNFLRELLLTRAYQVNIHSDIFEFSNLDPKDNPYHLLILNISNQDHIPLLKDIANTWLHHALLVYSDLDPKLFQALPNIFSVIGKPINPNELLELLEQALEDQSPFITI